MNRFLWAFPALSIALATFIFTAAHVRSRMMERDTLRRFEDRVRFSIRMAQTLNEQSEVHPERIDPSTWEIKYIALQSADLLTTSTGSPALSGWESDPVLAQVQTDRKLRFRTKETMSGKLLEGIAPLSAGDNPPVIRVGVDVQPGFSAPRIWVVFLLSSLLILVSIVVTIFLRRGERLRLEAERQAVEREAETRHWQAIGQMAATVAHEVRNPLNTVKMAAQRLQHEFEVPKEDEEEYQELLSMLQNESDRVGKVVTEFLELGRPLVLSKKALSATEILNEAVMPHRLRAEKECKKIDVRCDFEGELYADRQRLIQIVSNLMINALDALTTHGTVSVHLFSDEEGVHLRVEDDGPGMGAATLEHVQEPFITTKTEGTGLGLPLAQRLAGAHGGRLTLESAPGEGTKAHLFLPAASGPR